MLLSKIYFFVNAAALAIGINKLGNFSSMGRYDEDGLFGSAPMNGWLTVDVETISFLLSVF
jgi:hypothetical protein